jgi:hypothetical protein
MSSDRYGFGVGRRPVAQPPLAAYLSLLVRIAGAVMVSGLLSWGLPKRSLIYWQAWAPANWSEHVWGVDVAQGLVFFLPDFFVSRVASPFVLGPIVIAGFVAVVLAFHDHR